MLHPHGGVNVIAQLVVGGNGASGGSGGGSGGSGAGSGATCFDASAIAPARSFRNHGAIRSSGARASCSGLTRVTSGPSLPS